MFLLLGGVSYWLGGRDHAAEGVWRWASTDSVFTSTAWYHSEPNGGLHENCLDMHYFLNWLWNDSICASAQRYVCERAYVFYHIFLKNDCLSIIYQFFLSSH